jgi:sensor histidine kinase regulating citrate/malate metabolism
MKQNNNSLICETAKQVRHIMKSRLWHRILSISNMVAYDDEVRKDVEKMCSEYKKLYDSAGDILGKLSDG